LYIRTFFVSQIGKFLSFSFFFFFFFICILHDYRRWGSGWLCHFFFLDWMYEKLIRHKHPRMGNHRRGLCYNITPPP
jgi:hypothetical protein